MVQIGSVDLAWYIWFGKIASVANLIVSIEKTKDFGALIPSKSDLKW